MPQPIDIKLDLTKVEFEILPDAAPETYDYDESPVVKALLEGNVVLVPHNTTLAKMYRYAKNRGKTLHKRKINEGFMLWLETSDK
jgi:hypothetical protein